MLSQAFVAWQQNILDNAEKFLPHFISRVAGVCVCWGDSRGETKATNRYKIVLTYALSCFWRGFCFPRLLYTHVSKVSVVSVLKAMERVRKTFFDPLATSKTRIREIVEGLPVGSAHPFNPEKILLCRTDSGIEEIDISSYPEDFFFNAVDLGELGEALLRRMAGFQSHLSTSSWMSKYD